MSDQAICECGHECQMHGVDAAMEARPCQAVGCGCVRYRWDYYRTDLETGARAFEAGTAYALSQQSAMVSRPRTHDESLSYVHGMRAGIKAVEDLAVDGLQGGLPAGLPEMLRKARAIADICEETIRLERPAEPSELLTEKPVRNKGRGFDNFS
jgi:hypothetical protein